MPILNDVHSELNETRVASVVKPTSIECLARTIAATEGGIAITGGRHAMGGQQFLSDATVIDMRAIDHVGPIDRAKRTVRIGGGATWPRIIEQLDELQTGEREILSIKQKQTGADELTIAGSVSANAHGRGIHLSPISGDIESLTIVDAEGNIRCCSRTQDTELFRHAIGGYGLFGVIAEVELRLVPRQRLRRIVELLELPDILDRYHAQAWEDVLYGDYQVALHDEDDNAFLNTGIMSAYFTTDADDDPVNEPQGHAELSHEAWLDLLTLAHTDRRRAFELYSSHYLSTSGQRYDSDRHQLSPYLPDFARAIDERVPGPASRLMITELYVDPDRLDEFMARAREVFRRTGAEPIYSTIRAIAPDEDSALPWATRRLACIIFNIRLVLTSEGRRRGRAALTQLIDEAIAMGGSYYLTYHRYASPAQLESAYPSIRSFFAAKDAFDPQRRFRSDWYDHYAGALAVG